MDRLVEALGLTPEQRAEYYRKRLELMTTRQEPREPTSEFERQLDAVFGPEDSAEKTAARRQYLRRRLEGTPRIQRPGREPLDQQRFTAAAARAKDPSEFMDIVEDRGFILSDFPTDQRDFLRNLSTVEASPEDEQAIRNDVMSAPSRTDQMSMLAQFREGAERELDEAEASGDEQAILDAAAVLRTIGDLAEELFGATAEQ